MIKFILSAVLVFCSISAKAQQDFVVLKKRNKTIETFFTGSYISFLINKNNSVSACIKQIKNDSLLLKPFYEVVRGNPLGLMYTDTIWQPNFKIAVTNIYAFPRTNKSFEYIKNGTIFQIGSAGYVLLNVINALSNNNKLFDADNSTRLGFAAGIFSIGEAMHLLRLPVLVIGKKYKLQYIRLSK